MTNINRMSPRVRCAQYTHQRIKVVDEQGEISFGSHHRAAFVVCFSPMKTVCVFDDQSFLYFEGNELPTFLRKRNLSLASFAAGVIDDSQIAALSPLENALCEAFAQKLCKRWSRVVANGSSRSVSGGEDEKGSGGGDGGGGGGGCGTYDFMSLDLHPVLGLLSPGA